MKPVLIAVVIFALPLLVLYQAIVADFDGQRADDRHHDRRGLPVLLRVGVHGGARRLVEQPGVRHHDRDDHFRVARADRADGPRRAARPDSGDHDRRRRLLRGCSRGRQPPGSQGRPDRRRDAVAATGDARDRRRLVRVRDGAGAQPAREGLRDRRADGGAPEPAARPAGDSHGVGFEGHVRRRAAVGHGLDRRA